jgi:hypothetical protein
LSRLGFGFRDFIYNPLYIIWILGNAVFKRPDAAKNVAAKVVGECETFANFGTISCNCDWPGIFDGIYKALHSCHVLEDEIRIV